MHRHAADEMSDDCIMTTLPHDEAAVATLPCAGGGAATSSGGGGVFCLGGCRKSSQLDIGINSQIPGIWNVRRFLESVRVDRLWHFYISAFLHLVPPNVNEVTTKTIAVATKGNLTACEPKHARFSLARALSLVSSRCPETYFAAVTAAKVEQRAPRRTPARI